MKITHKGDVSKRRRDSYPSPGDQLDALWKMVQHLNRQNIDIGHDAEVMLGKIQKVKDTFHKV